MEPIQEDKKPEPVVTQTPATEVEQTTPEPEIIQEEGKPGTYQSVGVGQASKYQRVGVRKASKYQSVGAGKASKYQSVGVGKPQKYESLAYQQKDTQTLDDTDEQIVLEELLDRSKGVKDKGKQGGYKHSKKSVRNLAKTYADAKFKKTYNLENFATNLIQDLTTDIGNNFRYIKQGQAEAVASLEKKFALKEARRQHYRNILMASINILNAFIPIGAAAVSKSIQNKLIAKYLGKNANPDLVTKVRQPKWAEHIESFGTTAYRSAVVSTIGQVKGLWQKNTTTWKHNVTRGIDTLHQQSNYLVHHLMLTLAQQAEQHPEQLNTLTKISDLKTAINNLIQAQVFPQLANANLIDSESGDNNSIQSFAKEQFLKEVFFYGGKLNTEGEVSHKSYKTNGEVSEHALSALQDMNLQKGKHNTKTKGSKENDAYSTLEAITQGSYDLAYQNLRSTLQYMGLEYNFDPSTHDYLRKSVTLGEKNWRLGLKVNNVAQFRKVLTNGFPKWIAGTGTVFPRRIGSLQIQGEGIQKLSDDGATSVGSKSGSTHLDFSEVNFSNVIARTRVKDIIDAKKGTVKDLSSFELYFEAAGKVYTIHDLAHAGKHRYGPKNIQGEYKIKVLL